MILRLYVKLKNIYKRDLQLAPKNGFQNEYILC